MTNKKEIAREQVEAWLSPSRHARYLSAAEKDDRVALELYLWNTGLAQAALRDVSFFKIALRNAYSRCIERGWQGNEHWLFDDSSPVRRPIIRTNKRKQVVDSNRINRNTIDILRDGLGANATPDDLISNLTLGFWAHMTDTNHERDLWIPLIHKVWKPGTSRKEINAVLAEINKARNRAAHHEHLFAIANKTCNTRKACSNAIKLFAKLQPEIAEYVFGDSLKSSADDYIENNPAPCDIDI